MKPLFFGRSEIKVVIAVIIGMIIGAGMTVAATPNRLLSGIVYANERDVSNGVFTIGQGVELHLTPGSVPIMRMKELRGKVVDFWFEEVPERKPR